MVDLLLSLGNVALDGGFVMNPDGWRCRLGHPIDFETVRRKLEVPASINLSDVHDTILDTLSWCSIEGPGAGEPDVTALVAILLDRTARIDERDDAAMYLRRGNDDAALTALLNVASDPGEDELVLASSGESLAQIFVRSGRLDPAWLHELTSVALHEVIGWVIRARPDLLSEEWLHRYTSGDAKQGNSPTPWENGLGR
jgi:hypothetical protein